MHVILKLDETAAATYINKKDGTISKCCNDLIVETWKQIVQHTWLTGSNVIGDTNVVVDLRSQVFFNNKEWTFNTRVFV